MNEERAEQAWKAYQSSHDLPGTLTGGGEDFQSRAIFVAGIQNYERLMLGGQFEVEWGIAYIGAEFPVDPIKHPKAARGIFSHYGVTGDRLVKRLAGVWETVQEKF